MKKIKILVLAAVICLFSTVVLGAGFQLDWTANTEADLAGYKIYQSTTSGTYGTAVATLGEVVTWASGSLADGTYYFTITAIDDSGNESLKSDEVFGTLDTIAPGKTLGLTRTIISKNTVQLNWTASVATDIVGYKVYQSATPGIYGTAIASLGKVVTWTSSALADGTYYFTVAAVDISGNEGLKADELSAKIDTAAPGKPTGLKRTLIK